MKWEDSNVTQPAPKQDELEKIIARCAEKRCIPAKTVFLEPGDHPDGVYYIADGRARLYMIASDGSEKILYALSSGWFFGEAPCELNDATRLYSQTETACSLYFIPKDVYDGLLEENAVFRRAILRSYSKKIRILREEVESLSFNSLKDRLKRLYCSTADTGRLVDGHWHNLKINYTQYEISTIVGGARVTVSKLIGDLCQEGFLRVLNRRVQINAECCTREKAAEFDE